VSTVTRQSAVCPQRQGSTLVSEDVGELQPAPDPGRSKDAVVVLLDRGEGNELLIVSALFGLAHSYEGPAVVVEIGLLSVPDRHPPGDAVDGWSEETPAGTPARLS